VACHFLMYSLLRKKNNLFLILILVVAAFLRFGAAYPGHPPYHSDEGISYSQGITIIRKRTLDANGYRLHYAYPGVVPISNAFSFLFIFLPLAWEWFFITNLGNIVDGVLALPLSQTDFERVFQLDILGVREINVLTWGRLTTAAVGVGVVFLGYALAKKVFGVRVGLISAALIAVNFRQVLNSTIGLPDIYNSFFLLLSLLATYNLFNAPTRRNYLIAGILAGVSFSTKFHLYAFAAIAFVHSYHFVKTKNLELRKLFMAALASVFIVLVLNPFHFVNFEETLRQLEDVSKKYRVGKLYFEAYPFSYLFNFGLGRITSFLILAGMALAFLKDFVKASYLLVVMAFFFFVITYYTGGGFYTRNFVTITPLLLIFAGYFLGRLFSFGRIGVAVAIVFLVVAGYENLSNSYHVYAGYSQKWNFQVLSDWVEKNIPESARVAAHSSVPLPVRDVERLTYEEAESFSIEEFRESGAEFAIANLDWATNSFYWWMTRRDKDFFKYWNKPVEELESSHQAMSLRELGDYAVFSVINPWQSPDSNFIAAVIPEFEFSAVRSVEYFADPISLGSYNGVRVSAEIKDGFYFLQFYKSFADAEEDKNRLAVRLSAREMERAFERKELVAKVPAGAEFVTVNWKGEAKNMRIELGEVKVDTRGFALDPIYLDEAVIFPNSHGNL